MTIPSIDADIVAWSTIAEIMRDDANSFSAYAAAGCAKQFLCIVATLIAERDAARAALSAASGYLMNARIDLETGATKRTAIDTITRGLAAIRATQATPLPGEPTGKE